MASVGERLLASKLQILNGSGSRRPSMALNILTGRSGDVSAPPEHLSVVADLEPRSIAAPHRLVRQFSARTVYLSDAHLSDIDRIIAAWQQVEPSRLTRSAVLRKAVELLREHVEADPVTSLENRK
jgi:hypothetical protein